MALSDKIDTCRYCYNFNLPACKPEHQMQFQMIPGPICPNSPLRSPCYVNEALLADNVTESDLWHEVSNHYIEQNPIEGIFNRALLIRNGIEWLTDDVDEYDLIWDCMELVLVADFPVRWWP